MPILRFLITILLFAFLFYKTEFRPLIDSISNISLEIVLYLILLTALLLWLTIFKLGIIVEALGKKISTWKLTKFYLVSYFVNTFLPSSVGGDLHRTLKLGNLIGKEQAFGATIIERATGLFAMLSLSVIFIWKENISIPIRILILGLFLAFIFVMIFVQSKSLVKLFERTPYLNKFLPNNYHEKINNIQKAIAIAYKDKALFFKVLSLSYLFHAFAILNTQASGFAVGWWDASLKDLVTVVPIILVIGGIPVTPGNLGITEGAFFFFLKLIGASDAQALGTALVLRAKSLILGVIGGIIWACSAKKNNKEL